MTTTNGDGTESLSEEQQQGFRRAVPKAMLQTPFLAGLALSFDRYEPGDVVLRLPFREDLTNDGSYYHGGVIAAVIDTAAAAATWSGHDFNKGMRASTISMSIQYVGACSKSDLVCHARCVKRGKELSFNEVTANDAEGRVVAHAVQTYRIV